MATTSTTASTPTVGKWYLGRYSGVKGGTPIYAIDCGGTAVGQRQLTTFAGVKGSTPVYQAAHQNPPTGRYKGRYVGVKGGTPIYVIGECGGCSLPECSSPFTIPSGTRTIKFKTEGGTHPLAEQTLSATFVDSFTGCCTDADVAVNVDKVGDLFTWQYSVDDDSVSNFYICSFGPFVGYVSYHIAHYDSQFKARNAAAYKWSVRYCRLSVSVCAASQWIYGVRECGMQVTATLTTMNAFDQQANFWRAGKSTIDRDGSYYAGTGATGSLTEPVNVWNDWNFPYGALSAWPADPSLPTVSPTLPTCASPYCSISRTKFISGATSIPSGTVVVFNPADTNFTSGCSAARIFNPCVIETTEYWDHILNACGKPDIVSTGVIGSYIPTNYTAVCTGEANFFSTCPPHGPEKISRTRTTSDVVSHPRGTAIYDPSLGDWTPTL